MVFRRFAAVHFVQMATGMLFEKAACFLGIPESWHQTPKQLTRLTPRDSFTRHTEQLPAVNEQLGRALRARARHIEPEQLDTVLVAVTAKDRLGDTTRLLHGFAEEYDGLAGEHLGAPVALIRSQDATEVASSFHRRLRRVLGVPTLVCAALAPAGTEPLGRSVALASRCCRLLRGLGVRDGGTITEQLAMYTILFDPDRDQDPDAFLGHSLGKLVVHDAERGTDLMGTPTAYFANSRNLAGTARALHIHTNTLLKRTERIGSLLGHEWQRPDHALRLQLAVHLHDLARQVEQSG